MAFNAKNLQYDKQEPAFLRRMKGVRDAADGRHNVQIARPKTSRLQMGDGDEDEPVIVDEHGQAIGKTEFEDMQRRKPQTESDGLAKIERSSSGPVDKEPFSVEMSHERQQVAGVGTSRKRKPVRTIGGDRERTEDTTNGDNNGKGENHDDGKTVDNAQTTQVLMGQKADSEEAERRELDKSRKAQMNQNATKAKKRAKKIKLSFDDPD